MQFNAAEINDPGKTGGVVDYHFFCCAPGREGKCDRSQKSWKIGRGSLLIKDLTFSAVDKTLENDWSISDSV